MTYLNINNSIETHLNDNLPITITSGDTVNVYPANYQGTISGKQWIRLNVFNPTSELFYANSERLQGSVVFNIFVPTGGSMTTALEISDKLKAIFGNTSISGTNLTVQMTNSFITTMGVDPVDKGLFRLDLTINFNNYN